MKISLTIFNIESENYRVVILIENSKRVITKLLLFTIENCIVLWFTDILIF